MKNGIFASTIAALTVLVAAPVHASFIGRDITAQWLYPSTSRVLESHDVTVGSDVELTQQIILSDSDFSIDIGDDYVLFTSFHDGYWQDTAANGWLFTDRSNSIREIVGFTIGEVSGSVTGLDPEDLRFTANSIFINFGDSGPRGDNVVWGHSSIRFDVAFVPEPSAATLFGLSFFVLRIAFKREVCRKLD